MPIIELYSTRKKKQESSESDVYQYDTMSNKLINQTLMILQDIFDKYQEHTRSDENEYDFLRDTLCREYGDSTLSRNGDARAALFIWFVHHSTIDEKLDLIELAFKYLEIVVKPHADDYYDSEGNSLTQEKVDDAIDELNYRFRADSTGYQYINKMIIRTDSELIHAEIVKPVLKLLSETIGYEGVLDEYMDAHKNYRHAQYKSCLVDCAKSFESMMKVIHEKRGWDYDKKQATAKNLISSCFTNGLLPTYLQTQFRSFNSMLESGIPTIRNKEAGHGQGGEVKSVEEHLASYMLNLTATNILFIFECEKALA